MVRPRDFDINPEQLSTLRRIQLALRETRVIWSLPGQENRVLAEEYADFAGKIGIASEPSYFEND